VPSARALPRSRVVSSRCYLLQSSFLSSRSLRGIASRLAVGTYPDRPHDGWGTPGHHSLGHNCIGRLSPVLLIPCTARSPPDGQAKGGHAPPPPHLPAPCPQERRCVCVSRSVGSPHRAPYRARLGALPRSERTKNVKKKRSKREPGHTPPPAAQAPSRSPARGWRNIRSLAPHRRISLRIVGWAEHP
jgi:hypothetical protein